MQIDFHHATTYVLARLAGFDHPEADTVAYCSQYVDDAANSGIVRFTNGAMYSRISSAHKMVDYRNLSELANHLVWIPFHFLPGNGGLPAGESPPGGFIEKIVCKPDSPVARDLIRTCILEKNHPYGLHRLGITLHVYADTWAHQGFAGVNHAVNNVSHLEDVHNPGMSLRHRLKEFFGDTFDSVSSHLVGDALPLGHGAALSFPDRPYLTWRYRDSTGQTVIRDNTAEFLKTADALCQAMQRYRAGDPDAAVPGLAADDRAKIENLFRTVTGDDGDERHAEWLKKIADGTFGFAPVDLSYIPKGWGSWKHRAIGTTREKDDRHDRFEYDPSFLASDWKLFHDALQAFRFDVIHDVLPRYGICAA